MSNEQANDRHTILLEKSFAFGVRMVKLGKYLQREQHEFILAKQVMRSGTSIGANAEEAVGAISKAEFSAKLFIAYKEARETSYWLRLLHAGEYLPSPCSPRCTPIAKRFVASCLPSCALLAEPDGFAHCSLLIAH